MIRAVVFDLDDTLYPEAQFVRGGYRAVADAVRRELGFDVYDELLRRFEAGERGDLFTPTLRSRWPQADEAYVKQLVSIYRGHQPVLSPFPDVLPVLKELKVDYRLGLVSDGLLAVQQRKFHALGLESFFDAVVFTDQWGRDFWKPHIRPFMECAARLSVAPPEMIYLADNPAKDFVAPQKLGMRSIRVRRAGTLHWQVEAPPGQDADQCVGGLDGLGAVLRGQPA